MLTKENSTFLDRHIGPSVQDTAEMLNTIGADTLEQLVDETIPKDIRLEGDLKIPDAISEYEYLNQIAAVANKNKVFKNFIGLGYHGTITPSPILRNIFENPGWYTQYTPYQAEISQGRLEALLNFQTMVSDLTGLPIANASLLDEGTAAAEAMHMFYAAKNKRNKGAHINVIQVSDALLPQTVDILESRAEPLEIIVRTAKNDEFIIDDNTFAVCVQYPNVDGQINDYRSLAARCKEKGIFLIVCADILSLALLEAPGHWGADAVVGTTQRMGIPLGAGGPHAAYFATSEKFKRLIPGRIIGLSKDRYGADAYRMALQTREQHIKREKATSNICTAQALLAIMAGMYAVYHGPEGVKHIAANIHDKAASLADHCERLGFDQANDYLFDTLKIRVSDEELASIRAKAEENAINLFYGTDFIRIAIDETCTESDFATIVNILNEVKSEAQTLEAPEGTDGRIPDFARRTSDFMTHPVFNTYHTETDMMRYIKELENKDLSLMHGMIPLGSCTMKLNAATQLMPLSWPGFANIHPFAPENQMKGYQQIFDELSDYLCQVTGFTACSLQPSSGAQGELSGLLTIRAYHLANNEANRDISLIPSSAHGTNPASAVMAGMKVVVVKCDEAGNIDVDDLKEKAALHADNLSCLMVTYPSTHGVYETQIKEICSVIHQYGGKVYMDGANMNAQVGLTNPALIGADVCHLNLHKTFAIPHGGGGPGMGPICVNDSLAPYLPGHSLKNVGGSEGINAVNAAPWGSASILLISYAYIRLLGHNGLKHASEFAILNANYLKSKLEKHYDVLYTGFYGRAAHELIIDLRPFKEFHVSAEDVAKRLIDYGFHAPTLSFPVAGTIMIEPTESESKKELDYFCTAMEEIYNEIMEIKNGDVDQDNNVLANAPHPLYQIVADEWTLPYSRQKAAYPAPYLKKTHKFWSNVARVNNAYGDRNLICICPPISDYETAEI